VPRQLTEPALAPETDCGKALLAVLADFGVCSKEWIVRQYDHEVQGMSVLKPLVGVQMDGPGDAAVLQPLPGSRKGLAISCGANPSYGLLDAGAMAEAVIDEALRNVVAVGGDPSRTAILDNFSWGNCDKPDRLGSLVHAARGCYRAAKAYGTPFISGKDSLNNEYRVGDRTIAIPPTLLVSALALVQDVSRCVSMDLKRAGSRVYLLGRTRTELGGSQYLRALGLDGGAVPRPDLEEAPRLFAALHRAISSGLVLACHDLSEGGLAVAAAEMAFAGGLGLDLELAKVALLDPESAGKSRTGIDPESARLYSESCSRFLVEVAEGSAASFERLLAGLPCADVARVVPTKRFAARGVDGKPLFELELEELRRAHQGAFRG
jgi:phosphoribosylformylglycinamidine synthase